jgi:predicted DNA-binding transcriptional regulator AlpA
MPKVPEMKVKPIIEPRALTIASFCRAYDISDTTVWRRIKDGTLRSIKLGGRRLILLDSLPPPIITPK